MLVDAPKISVFGVKSPFSIDLRYRPYNSVSTNALQCDV